MKRFALQLFALLLTISVSAQDNMTIGKRLYEQAEGKRWSKTKTDLPTEFGKAVPYLEKATSEGFGEAAFLLAEIYEDGQCGKSKRRESFGMYQKSIELGYNRGYVGMGKCYLYGRRGVDSDQNKAYEFFMKGVESNEPDAYAYLALCCVMTDIAKKTNHELALKNFYDHSINHVEDIVFHKDINIRYIWALFYISDQFKTQNAEGQLVDQDIETYCEVMYNTKRTDWMLEAIKIMYEKNISSFLQRYYGNNRVSIYQIAADIIKQEDVYDNMVAKACYLYALSAERESEDIDDAILKRNYGMTRIEALTRAAELGHQKAQKLLGFSRDYVMLNLKGKVKSYELSSADNGNYWDFVGGKVEFDENGLIIKVNDQKVKLERNDKGQITKFTWKEQMEEDYWQDVNYMYSYDEKGQVTEIEYHGCYADYNSTFERNENGDVIKRINKSLTQGNETNKYQYTEFDEHGNWTKCISNGTIIRKITYWE